VLCGHTLHAPSSCVVVQEQRDGDAVVNLWLVSCMVHDPEGYALFGPACSNHRCARRLPAPTTPRVMAPPPPPS
jgi:hypothetical protein